MKLDGKEKTILPKEPIVPVLNSQQIAQLTNIVFGEEVDPESSDAIFVFAGAHPGHWEKTIEAYQNKLAKL